MARITFTRGDGKGGKVTKTGVTSAASAARIRSSNKSSGGSSDSRTPYEVAQGYLAGKNDPLGKAITPDSLKNTPAFQAPTPPPITDLTGQSNQINAMLAGAAGGTYDSATGFVNPPATEAGGAAGEKGFEDLFKSYLGTQEQLNAGRPSQEAFTREMQAELRPKENLVNSLQNRLQSIADTAKEKQLGLEGQGRGITDTLIGGQQARIGRDAAIESLTFQTQLAAAQGDLDSARSYLGQLYAAKSADAQAEYQYKTSLASSIYGFLDAQQKRRVDAVTKADDRAFGVTQQNLAFQRQLGLQALEYGQNGLISGISSIDPSSPTFEADMAAFTSQLRKPVAKVAGAKPQNIGTNDNPIWAIYDEKTNSFLPVEGAQGANTSTQVGSLMSAEKTFNTLNEISGSKAIDSLVGTTILGRGASGFGGVVGRFLTGGAAGAAVTAPAGLLGGPLAPLSVPVAAAAGFLGGGTMAALQGSKDKFTGDRQKLIVDLDNIIADASFTKLSTEKDEGATFGALSEGEWVKIDAAATTLAGYRMQKRDGEEKITTGYNTTEKNLQKEVDVLKYYTALDAMFKGASAETLSGMNVRQQDDGKYYYQNWDGSIVELKQEY